MNQITLRVLLLDGSSFEVVSSAGDIVKWEVHFDLGIDKLERASHLYYLAWVAASRTNKTTLAFDAWVDTISNVEVDDPKA